MSKINLPQDPAQRLEYLKSMCDSAEESDYTKKLSAEEISQRKSDFTSNSLQVFDLEAQKKELLDEFKEKLKPLKELQKSIGDEIRHGYAMTTGILYKFVDHDLRLCRFYSETGELIETKTRPTTTEELKQLTIAHMRRAVNE